MAESRLGALVQKVMKPRMIDPNDPKKKTIDPHAVAAKNPHNVDAAINVIKDRKKLMDGI